MCCFSDFLLWFAISQIFPHFPHFRCGSANIRHFGGKIRIPAGKNFPDTPRRGASDRRRCGSEACLRPSKRRPHLRRRLRRRSVRPFACAEVAVRSHRLACGDPEPSRRRGPPSADGPVRTRPFVLRGVPEAGAVAGTGLRGICGAAGDGLRLFRRREGPGASQRTVRDSPSVPCFCTRREEVPARTKKYGRDILIRPKGSFVLRNELSRRMYGCL